MNKYERFAVEQIFTTYPSNKSFSEIIALCKFGKLRALFEENTPEDEHLLVCERYQYEGWNNLPAILIDLRDDAEHHFKE